MAEVNTVSFSKYDSSAFPTLVESISHAATNPILIENLSDWMLENFDGEDVLIQEPSCTFKSMLGFFEGVLQTAILPESEYYRPEITAKRIYGNADLWYIILLVNNVFSIEKFNIETFKYIPAAELVRIEKFVTRASNVVRTVTDNDLTGQIL